MPSSSLRPQVRQKLLIQSFWLNVWTQRKLRTSQTLTMPLMSAVMICGLLGRHFTPVSGWLCPRRRKMLVETQVFQMQASWSRPALTRHWFIGEKSDQSSEYTPLLCPQRVFLGLWVTLSQRQILVSQLAVTRVCWDSIGSMSPMGPEWPCCCSSRLKKGFQPDMVSFSLRVWASQMWMMASVPPVQMSCLSAAFQSAYLTQSCISGTETICFILKEELSQKLMVRSLEEVAMRSWQGMYSAQRTEVLCATTSLMKEQLAALYTLKRAESFSRIMRQLSRSTKQTCSMPFSCFSRSWMCSEGQQFFITFLKLRSLRSIPSSMTWLLNSSHSIVLSPLTSISRKRSIRATVARVSSAGSSLLKFRWRCITRMNWQMSSPSLVNDFSITSILSLSSICIMLVSSSLCSCINYYQPPSRISQSAPVIFISLTLLLQATSFPCFLPTTLNKSDQSSRISSSSAIFQLQSAMQFIATPTTKTLFIQLSSQNALMQLQAPNYLQPGYQQDLHIICLIASSPVFRVLVIKNLSIAELSKIPSNYQAVFGYCTGSKFNAAQCQQPALNYP